MVKVFFKPQNLAEALEIRRNEKAIPFAGGTDLMVKHKRWAGTVPGFDSTVLLIGHLDELREIKLDDKELRIGAGCTLSSILEYESTPPVLKQAISNMASVAIRNVATMGGNICNASPAGDTLPALYALDAKLVIVSASHERKIPIDEFITGPGQNTLKDDEILKEIIISIGQFDVSFCRKVGTRKATALSKLSFIGLAIIDDEKIIDIRFAFGAVAPTVVRSEANENFIIGNNLQELSWLVPDIIEMYSPLIRPIDDQRSTAQYRKAVSLRLLEHFIREELK